jgi:single-strand DNA-binding protein
MAQNQNVVALTANLTRDPELKQAGDTSVCSLRVACNARAKVNGEWGEKPNYFDVTLFGAQAENAAKYLAKGRPVAITGRLDWREWEAADGSKRQAVQIIASDVQFLGSKDDAPSAASGSDGIPD